MSTSSNNSLPSGVVQTNCHVVWRTDYVREIADFFKPVDPETSAADEIPALRIGPLLSDTDPESVAYLRLIPETDVKPAKFAWILAFSPKPAGEPPAEILEGNSRLGGWSGVVRKLEQAKLPQTVSYHIKFQVDAAKWKCRVLPRPLLRGTIDEPVMALAPDWQIEQIGYRQPDTRLGILEFSIVFIHEKNVFNVFTLAKGGIELNARLVLPYAEQSIHSLMRHCFESTSAEAKHA